MSENYETKLIGIQNGRNFRELGGYKTVSGQTIKYNKLLRTGNLADLSSSDLELLQKHGVKYDVVYTDMVASGIIDPTKVSRSVLQNAASVASTLLTTESIVTDIPTPPSAAPMGGTPDMGGMY